MPRSACRKSYVAMAQSSKLKAVRRLSPDRGEHGRGRGALDYDRCVAGRVHSDRSHHQSRLTATEHRAYRIDRGERGNPQIRRGIFCAQTARPDQGQGRDEPVNVYEVTGLGPLRTRLQRSAGRGLTKFVAREREMDAMKAAAERATAGRGQLVAAMAEAGAGKSRLFYEFKVKNQSGWMVLEAFSVSHGKASAFLPSATAYTGAWTTRGVAFATGGAGALAIASFSEPR